MMRSFAVKGWLIGAGRISGRFVKLCLEFPLCNITLVLDGVTKGIDGTRLMQWMCVLTKIDLNPRAVLEIRLDGEGEEILFGQMISCLLELDYDNMFMIVLPNKAMQRSLSDPSVSSRGKFYSSDCLEAYKRF